MRPVIPYYPSGTAGAGLALLRLSVAYWLLVTASPENTLLWQQFTLAVVALAVAGGFYARLLSTLCLLFALEQVFVSSTTMADSFAAILNTAALALVGPGAFSIDATFFGRRTVVLPAIRDDTSR